MNNLYCSITGRYPDTMKLKLFLRLFFGFILGAVKLLFGMDWAFIIALVIVVSDLDEIERALKNKFKKDC